MVPQNMGAGMIKGRRREKRLPTSLRETSSRSDDVGLALRRAINNDELWPAFQPLVDLKSGAIVGFEVLARWTNSDGNVITPSVFIPIAERDNLIDALTEKIVTDACRQAAAWQGTFILAVNISPTQFRVPNLSASLVKAVQATGFEIDRIHIEITESALLEKDDVVRSNINTIKAAGMGLALDDFGTGFASLTSLHGFPFDKLKIDMSFVRSMQHNAGSRKIVASVIGLGQSLGMTVVAEGVETEEQAAILRRFGCDLGQGYLFGKPLDGKRTENLLNVVARKKTIPTRTPSISMFQRVHQLDALYKAAPIGLCFLDTALNHISVNNRFAEMFSLNPADMIGHTVHDFMPSREARHVTRDLQRVLAGETVVVQDYRPAGGNGSYFVINQRVDDEDGIPIGVSVTAIDITDQKSIENALTKTEENARWSIELSPNIPWSASADGVVTFMGPTPDGSKRMIPDRITDWRARMHPKDQARVREEWLAWLPSGKPFETMFRMRLMDDTWHWMLSRAKPHFDRCNAVSEWFGVITEVSIQEELSSKLERYQTILGIVKRDEISSGSDITGQTADLENHGPWSVDDHRYDENSVVGDSLPAEHLVAMLIRMFECAPIAMSITTSDTKTSSYVKVNDAYLRLIGRKWDDIGGKRLTGDGAAIDNPARDRRHRLLAEEGSYQLEEVDIAYADGTIIPTLISAQRTVIDGVSFDVEVIMDVSARVRQQREIENALRASARTDALSGLPNRAAFDEFLAEAVERNLKNNRKLALAYIDLNGFKAVNDTLGHAAGDEVLRTVASRLRENFRAKDFIARVGGDEFVVIVDIDNRLVGSFQAELLETMERVFKPIPVRGQVTFTGAAVGATFLQAGDDPVSYLDRADEFMYLAKKTGDRVAVVCFGQILEPVKVRRGA